MKGTQEKKIKLNFQSECEKKIEALQSERKFVENRCFSELLMINHL